MPIQRVDLYNKAIWLFLHTTTNLASLSHCSWGKIQVWVISTVRIGLDIKRHAHNRTWPRACSLVLVVHEEEACLEGALPMSLSLTKGCLSAAADSIGVFTNAKNYWMVSTNKWIVASSKTLPWFEPVLVCSWQMIWSLASYPIPCSEQSSSVSSWL